MNKIYTLLLFCFTLTIYGQERCGTDFYEEILKEKYPEYAEARAKVNLQTENWISKNNKSVSAVITVPVVVHVVYNTNAENISDAQIFSQMDVLNADYRRANADAINTPAVWSGLAVDCEIDFCLATVDPNGSPTTGITRTSTSQTSFSISSDNVKSSSSGGKDPWPQDDYLNIWVCDLGGGLLGYATPPSSWGNPNDGVVIGYRYFGTTGVAQAPYNKGRTATHEVGHWLNLDHVWGNGTCGNDNVSDTPKQEEANYSCPAFPHNTNSCGTSNSNGDMFMNYMDYTNDACMNMFTNGQKTRMIAAINQYRDNLLNHNLCTTTPPVASWNCINGACVDPGNGAGIYSNYNTCINNCTCLGATPPLFEDFQSSSLPNDWTIVNNDNLDTWEIAQVGFNSSSSIYINNADYPANGEYDDFILPTLDFSNLSSVDLTFDYAYSLWTNPNAAQVWSDTLIIFVSDDCGATWQNVWEKAGINLVTTTPAFNPFTWTPSNNGDWQSEIVNLNNFINQDDVAVKFRNVNQYENNLYIDNINIQGILTNIDEEVLLDYVVYPNPTKGILNIQIKSNKFRDLNLFLSNAIGEKIYNQKINLNDDSNISIDLSDFPSGIYFLNSITNNGEVFTKQISYIK